VSILQYALIALMVLLVAYAVGAIPDSITELFSGGSGNLFDNIFPASLVGAPQASGFGGGGGS